jgi:hypothetical protein
MIRIFGRFRQAELMESSIVRYILYATGEIFLVVVGILIALQVNTWNEARKARDYERVMLQEIRENVLVNLARYRYLETRLQTSNAGIHLLLFEMEKAKPDHDRLEHYFKAVNTGISFTYNRGAYDSVKAGGLDRLSNQALRSRLINHFDSSMPRISGFIDMQYKSVIDDAKTGLLKGLFQPAVSRDAKGLLQVKMKLSEDIDSSNDELLVYLAQIGEANQSASLRLSAVVAETEDVLAMLDAEIDGKPILRTAVTEEKLPSIYPRRGRDS